MSRSDAAAQPVTASLVLMVLFVVCDCQAVVTSL